METICRDVALDLELTYKCNYNCPHCCQEADWSRDEMMSSDEVKKIISDYYRAGGNRMVSLLGGEPTLSVVMSATLVGLAQCSSFGLWTNITSNGWWGKSDELTERYLTAFSQYRLGQLSLSYDKFHAFYHPWSDIKRIFFACERYGIIPKLSWVSVSIDEALDEMVELMGFTDFMDLVETNRCNRGYTIDFHPLVLIGRAAKVLKEYRVLAPPKEEERGLYFMPGNRFRLSCVNEPKKIIKYSGSFLKALSEVAHA